MNPFTLNLLLSLLRAAPNIASDVEKAVQAAESSEDAQKKIVDVLHDLDLAIKAISSVL